MAIPSEDRTPENNARIAAIAVEFSRFSHDEDCMAVIAEALGDAMDLARCWQILMNSDDGSWSYAEVHQVSTEEVKGFRPFIKIGLEVTERNGESLQTLGAFNLWKAWRARLVSENEVKSKTFACEHLRTA